jgi:hypothetical protein
MICSLEGITFAIPLATNLGFFYDKFDADAQIHVNYKFYGESHKQEIKVIIIGSFNLHHNQNR